MDMASREVSVDKISPNRRLVYEEDRIEDLVRSIRTEGQLEPLQVMLHGESFRILDGEKRWRACRKLGWKLVKAVILESDVEAGSRREPVEPANVAGPAAENAGQVRKGGKRKRR